MTMRRVIDLVRRAFGFGLLLLLPAGSPAVAQQAPAVQLSDITVATQPDSVTVFVKTSAPVNYSAELIDSPTRLVIDFKDTAYAWRKTPLTVSATPVKQIRGSQYRKGVTRVVLQLDRKVGYAIREDDAGLAIVIPSAANAKPALDTAAADTPSTPMTETAAVAAGSDKPAADTAAARPAPIRIAQAPTQRLAQAPTTPAPVAPAPVLPAPPSGSRLISLDFKDADVVNLLRILAAESGRNIVIGDDIKGKMSISLRNVPWELALETVMEARGLVKTERDSVIRIVSAEQLAKERETKARVEEAKLKAEADVRTKLAEAALKEQEAQAKKFAAEQAAAEAVARGPLREETIRLAYADPEDIAKTLSGILGIPEGGSTPAAGTPGGPPIIPAPPFSQLYGPDAGKTPAPVVLSPSADVLAKGITIRAHKPTNSIFIRHYANDLERIKKLIAEKLDVPLPQVKIEARLNEINRTDLFEIGVQWGGAGTRRDGQHVLVGQGFAPFSRTGGVDVVRSVDVEQRGANVTTLEDFLTGSTGPRGAVSPITNPLDAFRLGALLPVSSLTGLPLGGNVVNALPTNLPTGGVSFGIIGTRFNLNLALQALENQSKTRSLSRPEVVTVENSKASIVLGSEIPYATVSSAGTQIQFKEAALRLDVTPTVVFEPNNVNRIKMKLTVEDNSAGDVVNAGGGAAVPVINKRRAETEVLVKEGDTLVIGGITQRTETESERKVPLFGDIPILGWLFKTRLTQTNPNRELVIFVTPSIIRRDAPRAAMTTGSAQK
jgi:type IV pilus secretin PilQ/predicted competence protein